MDGKCVLFRQVIKALGVARMLENVEVSAEKPAKLSLLNVEYWNGKTGEYLPKMMTVTSCSGDSHPDFLKDEDVYLKNVDKILLIA